MPLDGSAHKAGAYAEYVAANDYIYLFSVHGSIFEMTQEANPNNLRLGMRVQR
jgi:hypothetical protein